MSPFEHALFASGLLTPRELDEAVARQLIFGGELATSLLETTELSEAELTRLTGEATGQALAPRPPWTISLEASKLLQVNAVPALALVGPGSPSVEPGFSLLTATSLSSEQLRTALTLLGREFEVFVTLELRFAEALAELERREPDERLSRLLNRLGRWPHRFVSRGVVPEPMAPLRTEYQVPSSLDIENTAPPPVDYEDLAARAALDTTPSSRLGDQKRAGRARETPALEQAASRDELMVAALELLNGTFRFAACFAVQKGEARGTFARSRGAAARAIQHVAVPLDFPSVFQRALEKETVTVARPKASGVEGGVLEDLDRSSGTEVLLIPIRVKKRPVLLLWVDNGIGSQLNSLLSSAEESRKTISEALERILLARKRQSQFGPASNFATAGPRLAQDAAVLSPQLDTPGFDHRSARRAPSAPPARAAPEREMTPVPGALAPAELERRQSTQAPSEPHPEANALAARVDGQALPDPGAPADEAPEFETQSDEAEALHESRRARLSARTLVSRQPYVEGSKAVPGMLPTHLGDAPPPSLRPSQLPPPDEYEALVERLAAGDESVLDRFLDGGEAAVAALMLNFPGQVQEPRNMKVRPQECGPVLKALVHIGRRSIPFLTVRTWDESPKVRRWATLTLGELPSEDSGEAIATRLLDRSPEVRRAALAAARRVQNEPIARRALRAVVENAAFDTSLHPDSRAGAVEALVDIRESESIPAMLRLMEDPDKSVRRAAKWALTVLLRQDFGTDLQQWKNFWAEHQDEDRVEWLILALDHPSADLRRAAGDELSTMAGDSFGFEPQQSPAERRVAQLRYRTWWEEQGKPSRTRS